MWQQTHHSIMYHPIFQATEKLEALGISKEEIKCVGLANQRGISCWNSILITDLFLNIEPSGQSKHFDSYDLIWSDKILDSETTVVWDKETGLPLCNAIVWLDNRTATLAEESIELTETKYCHFEQYYYFWSFCSPSVLIQNHFLLF